MAGGNTGLTFITLARLFPKMSGGVVIAPVFFLAMVFAAFTSLIAMVEVGVKTLMDGGWPRKKETLLVVGATFLFGLPSAIAPSFLDNQDWVWGVALLLSGFFIMVAVWKHGAEKIRREQIAHISVEELDYAQLLRGEGEEIKDIWPYLLMEAVEEEDPVKLDQMAESFEKVAGKFNAEDLIQNEELQKSFVKFFRYLKETAEEKHRVCAKDLLRSVLAGKKVPVETKFENLKLLISNMGEEDMASTLWEEIIGNDKFDSLSFSVFAKIISKERHKKISTSLRDLFHTDDPRNRRPEVERKLRMLLSGTSGEMLSDIYRQTLSNLLSEISFEKQLTFDHRHLERNYRYVLLNLLARESDPRLDDFIDRLRERAFDWWVYMDKMFTEKTVTPTLLRAFFGFFPAHLSDFFARLKTKVSDSRLLGQIAACLQSIDTPVSLAALKTIYSLGDSTVKLQALNPRGAGEKYLPLIYHSQPS